MSLWIGKYGEAIDARARFSLPCQIVSKTVHMRSLRVESRLLQPYCLTWWVFPVSQWACLSMQDPRTAMPRWRLDLLAPQGEGPPLQTFSSLQSFPKGAGPNPMPFSLSYLVTWRSLLQLWLHKSFFLPISCWFSMRIVPHVSVFLLCCEGGKLHVLLLYHLDSPPQVYFSNWI